MGRRPDLGRVESPFGRAPLCVQGGGLSSSAASLVLRPSLPRDLDTDSDDPLLELVRRWHAGDRGALEQLLTEVEPWLRREVHRAMSGKAVNAQESSDLSQQAILNFLESGPRILPRSGAQFRALLRRIALNELIDQSRRGRLRDGLRADTLFGASDPASRGFGGVARSAERPSRIAAVGEDWNWLRLALQYLEADDRELLVASEVDGESWDAIAQRLELPSPDAARVRAARLKPRLASLLRRLRAGRVPDDDPRSSGG